MDDCIFCKIAAGDIPTKRLYEDELVLCFPDLNPLAPVHILIIPKIHCKDLTELAEHPQCAEIMAAVARATKRMAEEFGIAESGFRLINNCGPHGCQSVFHVHFHLLGGKQLPADLG